MENKQQITEKAERMLFNLKKIYDRDDYLDGLIEVREYVVKQYKLTEEYRNQFQSWVEGVEEKDQKNVLKEKTGVTEDTAFQYYELPGIGRIIEVAKERIDEYFEEIRTHVQNVLEMSKGAEEGKIVIGEREVEFKHTPLVPTDEQEVTFEGDGSGEWKENKYEERVENILYLLKVKGIELEDVEEAVGKVDKNMMRNTPYYRIYIKKLKKLLYVCNESGNMTFVFHDIRPEIVDCLDGMGKKVWKDHIDGNEGKNVGEYLRYGKDYIQRLDKILFEDDKEDVEKETAEGVRAELNKIYKNKLEEHIDKEIIEKIEKEMGKKLEDIVNISKEDEKFKIEINDFVYKDSLDNITNRLGLVLTGKNSNRALGLKYMILIKEGISEEEAEKLCKEEYERKEKIKEQGKLEELLNKEIIEKIEKEMGKSLENIVSISKEDEKFKIEINGVMYTDSLRNISLRIGKKLTGRRTQRTLGFKYMILIKQGKKEKEAQKICKDEYSKK